jgi:TRAP-type mannitol/chloroaromatic compound transport system permease small subunit
MSPDPGGLPRYWVKSLIPLGFLLLGLQGVAQVIRLLHGHPYDQGGEG